VNIAYDLSSLLIAPLTGVGNYTRQLLAHLLQLDRDNRYQLLSHRAFAPDAALSAHQNANWVSSHFPNRLVWTQCVLPLTLRALQPAIAHFPNYVAPLIGTHNLVITVHDLGLFGSPHLYTRRQRLLMRPFIKPSARRARAIIVVSEHCKREVERVLKVEPAKVQVVHEAAAPFFNESVSAAECAQRLARYGWDGTARNLLAVGTLEPRKNLGRLIGALQQVHQRGTRVHLWLVGQAGWQSGELMQRAHALGLHPFVHHTGYVPAEDLRAFYHACDLFVLPSLLEGFGLSVVEAMACGALLVISDTPVLREITGDAACYFDPCNEDVLAEVLYEVLSDGALAEDLRARTHLRAEQFSWQRAARETLRIYHQAAEAYGVSSQPVLDAN
jgi:glycosyltransferase involved in cell wall biosynthesis